MNDAMTELNWALIIAVLAFGISVFNAYWTHFRIKRAFYFLRVADFRSGMAPEFALINGGSRDELILSISCIFEHNKKGEATYPDQVVQIDKDNVRLLAAGKAYRCTVRIDEYFSSDFTKQGRRDSEMGGYYVFQMTVQIEWCDMDGNVHRKSIRHSDFGFDETGVIRLCKPLVQRVDLYAKSPPLTVVPIEAKK